MTRPLPVLCAAQFVLQVDFTIVNVAVRTIQHELGFTPASLQWVVTGYALTFGSLLLLGGRLGDVLGLRRVLLGGLAAFGIASVACGLAWSPVVLVAARLVQGAGAAVVAPTILAILTTVYPEGPARARAMSIWTAASAAGGTVGTVAGGLLTQYLGWRSIFLVNIPVIGVLLWLARRRLPDLPGDRTHRLHPAGAALASAVLAALILGLSSGAERGYASPVAVVSLGVAAAGTVAFVLGESRLWAPMLPWSFLAVPVRRLSVSVMLVVGGAFFAYAYLVTLYLQLVLGFSAVLTAVALLPTPVTLVLVSTQVTRRLVVRAGLRATIVAGLLLLCAGQVWLAGLSPRGYAVGVLPALVLSAAGAGVLFPALPLGVTTRVTAAERGVASGLAPTAQQVGAAVGLAVLSTVAAAVTAHHGGALTDGYRVAYLVSAIVLALTAGLAVVTARGPERRSPGRADPGARDAAA